MIEAATTPHRVLLRDGARHQPGRRNFRTALANPSFSLLSVTALAWAFTSSLELPMAMEKPLFWNIRTSFGMSPIVAICAGRNVQTLGQGGHDRPFVGLPPVTSRK